MSIADFLNETITVFPINGTDVYGKPQYGTKKEIKGRWEDIHDLIVTSEGTEVQVRSRVFLRNDVNQGDVLYRGTTTATDPTTLPEARQVVSIKRIKTIDGSFELKVALL